jgi:homoserine O-acetyltransferase/O-succinyltransferase
MLQTFHYNQPFTLESGKTLPRYHLAYTTYGRMNEARDNVIWIFHALTANSDPAEWWAGMVGEGKLFDPQQYFIVCVNMPGSCYGSLGPLDTNPETGQPYYHDFPFFTTRDMIRTYQPLKEFLGIDKILLGIGGSMGGQQLLEWSVEEPELFTYIFPLATNAQHSPWGIAFNTTQRMCIEADSTWKEKQPEAGIEGMKAARAAALLSYRHYDAYLQSQPRSPEFPFGITWDGAASYQRYQGEKLAKRFNAFSYYVLSQSMDSHDVGRNRAGVLNALQKIRAKTLVIGIETDVLFPIQEQEFLAEHIPGGVFKKIQSPFGHDGFLLEFDQLEQLISDFMRTKKLRNTKVETFR